MALTVDQLLAEESSSDDEAPQLAENSGGGPNEGGGHTGPDERGLRPVLTVEEALAQGDLSDDDDDDFGAPTQGASSLNVPAAGALSAAGLEPSSMAGVGGGPDSADEAGEIDPSSAAGLEQQALAPRSQDQLQQPRRGQAKGEDWGSQQDMDTFIQDPFKWCRQHERSIVLGDGDESAGLGLELEHSGAANSTPGSGFAAVETRSCTALRRLLTQELGLPTCVVTSQKCIAVGCFRGSVVLLDPKDKDVAAQPQILTPAVGTGAKDDESITSVTAVAFSPDGGSMLVGHKSGQLVLWDLAALRVATVVKDVHTCPVLAVAFVRRTWQHALSADSTGSVFLLTFTSTFGRRDCQRQSLIEPSSAIGTTLRILPLPPDPHQTKHPADEHCLVALCATNTTVLLTLQPTVQLLQKMQYHTKETTPHSSWIPDAVWLRPEIREWTDAGQAQTSDPQLCIAFGQTFHIMRVHFEATKTKEEFTMSMTSRHTWVSPIQSIVSFNESVLAIFDSAGKLSVVQLPPSAAENGRGGTQEQTQQQQQRQQLVTVHAEDVSSWSLVYQTNAPLDGGARSYHSALAVFRGKGRALYVCGMKEVWSMQIQRWGQHVEELVGRGAWTAALDVFLALYDGALPPMLDFPQRSGPRKRAVGQKTTQIVQSYLVSRLLPDTPREKARQMCTTAVAACVAMKLWSVLYKTVFECFKASGHMNIYCSTLEPFIVTGRIPRSQMDSEVLSSILQSYALTLEEEEQLALQHSKGEEGSGPQFVDCDHCPSLFPAARRLQRVVLYVDVSQLDLNAAIRLFTRHRLWTALVHVYCALGAYLDPLELLIGESTQMAKQLSKLEGREVPLLRCCLVRKLFFFLHRVFQLRPFPLDADDGPGVATPSAASLGDLLVNIFRPETRQPPDGPTRAPPLFLRLLRLSPLGFFSVLSQLFTSPAAKNAIGGGGNRELGDSRYRLSPAGLLMAIETAVESSKAQAVADKMPLPPHTDSEFLWFIARAVPKACGYTLPPDQCVRVVEHLLAPHESPEPLLRHSKEEAQRLLIELLSVQEPQDNARRDAFIAKAMERGMYEAASWLHEEHDEYDRALDCRMRDDELREGIFEYLICKLAEMSGERARCASLVEATLNRLPRLVAMDAERCAAMVCEQFASVADHDTVLGLLKGYPQIELQYLETLLIQRRRSNWSTPEEHQAFFDSHVVRYVELLCSIAPSSVLDFLAKNEALPLRECLELCRKHAVTDASVYLLERTGDFHAVLDLLLSDFHAALNDLHQAMLDPKDPKLVKGVVKRLSAAASLRGFPGKEAGPEPEVPWYTGFQEAQRCVDLLEHAYELSSRNSNIMDVAQLEELWFGLLGPTVRRQEQVQASSEPAKRRDGLAAAYKELANQAMTGVLAYLSLPRSLQRLCAEYGSSALGVWKGPMESMLAGLSFQQGLLRAAKAVAAQDVVKPFLGVKRRNSRGILIGPGCFPSDDSGELKVNFGLTDGRPERKGNPSGRQGAAGAAARTVLKS